MARDRDDRDDRDEDEDDRPRRRPRRDEDDDYDDRPRRRRAARDDDYDDRPSEQLGPLDKTFRDTNIVVLVLFALCCRGIALVLSAICYFTAKDPKAKSNALVVMCIDAGLVLVAIVLNVTGVLGGFRGR